MAVAPRSDVLDIHYLFIWFQQFRLEDISSGSTVPQLNKQDLDPLTIVMPTLQQQAAYKVLCERINAQRHQLAESERKTLTLFASLQHRAFTGRLLRRATLHD